MQAFFNGWRRKFGCTALLLAILLSVVWGRSQFVDDEIAIVTFGHLVVCKSTYGVLALRTWPYWKTPDSFESELRSLQHHDIRGFYVKTNHMPDTTTYYFWTDESLLFGTSVSSLIVPFWSVVLPLALLSAGLIFLRPRRVMNPILLSSPSPIASTTANA